MSNLNTKYRCIGTGFCGSVWTLENHKDDSLVAIKREDGGPDRSITNDYEMHLCILKSAQANPPSAALSIPQCHQLIQPSDPWWDSRLQLFPPGYSPCRALLSERIPKVQREIRDKIVDLGCAGNLVLSTSVKENPGDDACLIRPYLGRRRHRYETTSKSPFQRFSLRNVPLHMDQMEELSLDFNAYAETMAEALALMYWGAQVDANDVEFVLAPPRETEHSGTPHFQSEFLGTHRMWILDFDCCHPLSMDEIGMRQACAAFYKNDPFYPQPGTGDTADEELWEVFKQRYLLASRRILGEEKPRDCQFAEDLIEQIEREGRTYARQKNDLIVGDPSLHGLHVV
ncbi:zinc finger protein-domain-containing protein [Paraphoma chrysanthemicola]|uniref:Zinc finger protein-domain-containing protein n=1 Tax=Paraphoma chrysanthemicola TaxID=798071 RepID=A0A8K0VXK5_9PLEO|nr:zinc finger protein-domain-containing protein [Paraphoma chrysanthemicola]